MFETPKRHILAQNREFWRILRQNPSTSCLCCSELQEPPQKLTPFGVQFGAQRGNKTPGWLVTNFCTGVGVHNVITSADFYDSRLWGFGVVRGQILGFSIQSIDLHPRPYNTVIFRFLSKTIQDMAIHAWWTGYAIYPWCHYLERP